MRFSLLRLLNTVLVAAVLLPAFTGCQTTRRTMARVPGFGWAAPKDQMDFDELESSHELTPPSESAQPHTSGLASVDSDQYESKSTNPYKTTYPDTGYPEYNLASRDRGSQPYKQASYGNQSSDSQGDSYLDKAKKSVDGYRDAARGYRDAASGQVENYRTQAHGYTDQINNYTGGMASGANETVDGYADQAQNTIDDYSDRAGATYDAASNFVQDKKNHAIDGVKGVQNGITDKYRQANDAVSAVRDQATRTYNEAADTYDAAADTYQETAKAYNEATNTYSDWADAAEASYQNANEQINNQAQEVVNEYAEAYRDTRATSAGTKSQDAPAANANQYSDWENQGYQAESGDSAANGQAGSPKATYESASRQRDYSKPWRPGSTSTYSTK